MEPVLHYLENEAPPWLLTGAAAAAALVVVLIAMRVLRAVAVRLLRMHPFLQQIVIRGHAPLTVTVAATAILLSLQAAPDTLAYIGRARHVVGVGLIGAITWLLIRCVAIVTDVIIARNPLDAIDNIHARAVLTQTRVLTRTLNMLIALVGGSIALMTFPEVRQIGTSLLASAGIAGLAVGLAAKPVLGNLLAGLQIAFTQPIRLDDVVVLEGEWGRIEEITGTYVVVAIWDQRRLIVPLQYFIEKPFQNWTRRSSDILGTVMLWVDCRLPVDAVRTETERLCKADKDWDGRVGIVQVTDTSEASMQLRILLSSPDSGRNFDLRCRVREGLLAFIAHEYPAYLPHLRTEIVGDVPPASHHAPALQRSDVESPTPTAPQD